MVVVCGDAVVVLIAARTVEPFRYQPSSAYIDLLWLRSKDVCWLFRGWKSHKADLRVKRLSEVFTSDWDAWDVRDRILPFIQIVAIGLGNGLPYAQVVLPKLYLGLMFFPKGPK